MLRERDVADGANIGLIGLVARHALDSGFHTVVEGILDDGRYGAMVTDLVARHRSTSVSPRRCAATRPGRCPRR
ncbi:hypothetical protein ACFVZ3_08295 [Kitasatospora purpeofusca]|uniref:hypothetical protein n=1 Tax=Kitasatospora purpeofusca TaxID=67352 RepID=UPI0036CE5CB9